MKMRSINRSISTVRRQPAKSMRFQKLKRGGSRVT